MEMNKKGIYTITTLRGSLYATHRCIGFFHEKENAIESIEHNDGDMYEEGYYPYAVIENVLPGIYHFNSDNEVWFRWNRKLKCYKQCEKPDKFKRTVCFGIG